MKRWQSAGRGRAREHGVEPVVIGFVKRMVRGADVGIQLGKAGFGRLSNSIEDQKIAAFGSSYRATHFKCRSC
ncbi:hypothetical protein, partial [Pseudomonas sp. GXM4]|uniref:hypothetical protein n=1 Tax=Pseudomonas sp. GXM4 TaxID=2651867 RepID=UPI001C49973F